MMSTRDVTAATDRQIDAIMRDARLAPHLSAAARVALEAVLRDRLRGETTVAGDGAPASVETVVEIPVREAYRATIDGACSGNPGPGGWAVIFEDGRRLIGGEDDTTNNRMELFGAIVALANTPVGGRVEVETDSALVIGLMTEGWKAKANGDLVAELRHLAGLRQVTWTKLKGHAGHPRNELADALAASEAQRRRARLSIA